MGRFEAFIGVNFWTGLVVLVNTLILYFVAKKYLFGPVMEIIHARQAEIDGLYTAADDSRAQADALKRDYESRLAEARAASDRLVQEATARASRREEEILRQARAQADALRDRAAEDIGREREKAVAEAKQELSDLALAIAGKVVGRVMSPQDQAGLVEQFLRELEP